MARESSDTIIRVRGKDKVIPAIEIGGRKVVMPRSLLRHAFVHDEAFVQGPIVEDPWLYTAQLKQWYEKPDIFSFPQKIGEECPKYNYYKEWDDFAVIWMKGYEHWLKVCIKKDARENLRRAAREGIITRSVVYDDDLVAGIKQLYDETPIRQGKRFWHYGKTFEEIKELHGTYKERAEFIGAYLGEELVGFIKMVYVDNFAKTMHVISKERHFSKRPTNALIAKAVEVCHARGLSHFIYGEFSFTGKRNSSLTEFKRRNGFECVRYPRYFIPLTRKGTMAIRLNLHRGWQRHVPERAAFFFRTLRGAYDKWQVRRSSDGKTQLS